MNTKLLLSSSAVVMGAAALVASFLPHELLTWAAVPPAGVLPVMVQLTGALLFAFAFTNWTARGSLLGGIYNRPIAIGNLTHFTIGALALSKDFVAGDHRAFIAVIASVYLLFAIAFAAALFRSPVQPSDAKAAR